MGDQDDNFAELVRIERATAGLYGRDPDRAEETVREQLRAIDEKKKRDARFAEDKSAQRAALRRRRWVLAATGFGVMALVAIAVPTLRWLLDEWARKERMTAALDDRARGFDGFVTQEQWVGPPPDGVGLKVARGTCAVVIATSDGGEPVALKAARAGETVERLGAIAWCACADEDVKVNVGAPLEHVALRWLSAKAEEVGGARVLSALRPEETHLWERDLACAYVAAAAWSQHEGRGALAAGGDVPAVSGFTSLGVLPPGRDFAVVQSPDAHCHYAELTGGASITLRGPDGAPLASTTEALGWCNYGEPRAFMLWREGDADALVSVHQVAAARLGGITGLRELGERRGHQTALAAVGDDLAADAIAALIASGASAATIQAASADGLSGAAGNRLVALVTLSGATLNGPGEPHCLPESDEASLTATVCVQGAPAKWTASGGAGSWGAAEAELPPWLWVMQRETGAEQMNAMARMLRLARRLHVAGYEATAVDGVEVNAWGADVSPRGAKKEVIAVGLTRTVPFLHPLGDDSEPWSLDGEPDVVAMPPEGKLTLKAARPLGIDAGARGVVVWRR